jgi:hypothetical protein
MELDQTVRVLKLDVVEAPVRVVPLSPLLDEVLVVAVEEVGVVKVHKD